MKPDTATLAIMVEESENTKGRLEQLSAELQGTDNQAELIVFNPSRDLSDYP